MDAKNLEITYSFSRLSNGPLDKSSHFDSKDDLENAYIHSTYTDSPFYDGEVVTVSDSNGGTAYVYQNYNGQAHLDPIILNSEFNCSIVLNTTNYIEASKEQALKITNKYADDSAQKIDTSLIGNLKFVGKCEKPDIGDRTSAFWASTPGNVWFISESFEIDSKHHYEAYSHIICIAGPMSTGQNFHDRFSVLGPVYWHGKTINAYTQDESNTKYMYKEDILDDVISQESNTLFGKLNNAVFSSLETNKTEFNILRNIYGKSLVWNQQIVDSYISGSTNKGTTSYIIKILPTNRYVFKGHKVFVKGRAKLDATPSGNLILQLDNDSVLTIDKNYLLPDTFYEFSAIKTIISDPWHEFRFYLTNVGEATELTWKNVNVIDLTLMFGAGNEPATVEEFKEIFPEDHYPYNPGEIISNKTEKLEMTGFNLLKIKGRVEHVGGDLKPTSKRNFSEGEYWNGFAYNGYFLNSKKQTNVTLDEGQVSATGIEASYGIGFPIKCEPNTQYYYKTTYGTIGFFDQEGVSVNRWYTNTTGVFTTPANAAWMVIVVGRTTGAYTESNLIVNVSNTDRNGTYEPYKHNDLLLNLTTLTGKLNGIGERVTIFPDGMGGKDDWADAIYQVGNNGIAVKRTGRKIFDGTENWSKSTNYFYTATISSLVKPVASDGDFPNIMCDRYSTDKPTLVYGTTIDKAVCVDITGNFAIRDTSYSTSTATQFAAAMSGLTVEYELATPLIYTDLQYADQIDIPFTLPVRYKVDNFGTEEIVVPNSIAGEPTSCAPNITIKYNANTIDQDTFIYRTTGGSTDVASGNAYIEKVQGNEVVWNQLNNVQSNIIAAEAGDSAVIIGNTTSDNTQYYKSHKYYFRAQVTTLSSDADCLFFGGQSMNVGVITNTTITKVVSPGTDTLRNVSFSVRGRKTGTTTDSGNCGYENLIVIDLTLAGYPNIGTTTPTVAEVEAWLAKYVGYKNYYPYNAGTLLPMKMKAIRTIGFNQYEGGLEFGNINNSGVPSGSDTSYLRTNSYTRIFPSTQYFVNFANAITANDYQIYVISYDIEKNFIARTQISAYEGTGKGFTSASNASYIKAFLYKGSGFSAADKDSIKLCINLSGSHDGEYKSYWTKEAEFKVTEITGINSNTGQRETIFPNGMCGKGDWADIIYQVGENTVAVKKTGRVDLGTQDWFKATTLTSGAYRFRTNVNGIKRAITQPGNILCSKYATIGVTLIYNYGTQGIGINDSSGKYDVDICDAYYNSSTIEQFKTAMSGVYLDYELATPIIYTDLQYADGRPFNNLWFNTYKDGLIIQNPQTPLSVPMNMDYEKPYDMPAEYICMDSFDALLDQLGNSMGGTWTKTYNEEAQAYEFRFTKSN